MNEVSKHQVRKQLKLANAAIDLIKISQRTQHTSIKEALRKILRGISMIAEIEIEEVETDDRKKAFRIDLMKKAKEIRDKREIRKEEDKNDTNKTES